MASRMVVAALILMLGVMVNAQGVFAAGYKMALIVRDNGSGIDTLVFGWWPGATKCIDWKLGEREDSSPLIPGVFNAFFVDSCGARVKVNLLPPADWSRLRLQDLFGGVLVGIDMLTNNSIDVPAPFRALRIVTSGFDGGAPHDTFQIEYQPGAGGFPFHFSWALLPDSVAKEDTLVPLSFALNQNFPNPFNPSTSVTFSVEKTSATDIAVYDLLGRRITSLVSRELTPGSYSVPWDGTDEGGVSMGSGVYYVRMTARRTNGATAGNDRAFTAVRKLLLMK